jgi:DNA-directed RNA polymerase I, II, and III subunit RPABC5
MIIPIRCMSCGKLIADKWRYYQEQLKAIKKDDSVEKYYFDGKKIPDTPEKKVLDSLNMTKPCCRKHFLTQIDLLERI